MVFLLLIIPSSSQMRLRLTTLELSSLSKREYRSGANKTVYIFTYVYFGLTAASFLLYVMAGMSPFDAINHAMSVVATGGFSTRNASIGAYDSITIDLITMLFMVLSSVHFGMIFVAVVTRSLKPFKNEIFKFYLSMMVVAGVIVSISIKAHGFEEAWGRSFLSGFFHVMSFASTTGFSIADNSSWPVLSDTILVLMGVCCGMAGSTTGGIKSDRMMFLCKEVKYQLRMVLHPASVKDIRVNGRVIRQNDIAPHILYIALYGLVVIISLAACLTLDPDNNQSFTAILSSLGNVGLSVDQLGSIYNFNGEPSSLKFIYTLDMFLGRVEIYPILAVVMMIFSRRNK